MNGSSGSWATSAEMSLLLSASSVLISMNAGMTNLWVRCLVGASLRK